MGFVGRCGTDNYQSITDENQGGSPPLCNVDENDTPYPEVLQENNTHEESTTVSIKEIINGTVIKEQVELPNQRVLITRATTLSLCTTPRTATIQKLQSETAGLSSREENAKKQSLIYATSQSFEVQNVKPCETPGLPCDNRILNLPEKQILTNDQDDTNEANKSPKAASNKAHPSPTSSPLKQQAESQRPSVDLQQAHLLPPPPPPPPRPTTPPRVVVIKSDDESVQVEDITTFSPKQQPSGSDHLQLLHEPSSEEFFPAVDRHESISENVAEKTATDSDAEDFAGRGKNTMYEAQEDSDNPSFESALDELSSFSVSKVSDLGPPDNKNLSQNPSDGSSDDSNNESSEGKKKKSRLRKTMGKMRMLGGKKKRNSFPLPRRPSHSADTMDNLEEGTTFSSIDWFDTPQHSKDSGKLPANSTNQAEMDTASSGMEDQVDGNGELLKSSCLIKVNQTGNEQASNVIYWSGSADDLEVVAVTPVTKVADDGKEPKPSPTTQKLEVLQTSPSQQSHETESTQSTAEKQVNRSQTTQQTTKSNRSLGEASPRPNPEQPGVEPRAPKVGDTISTNPFMTACSSLSDSSSDGSGSSCSYSSDEEDSSCASDSAILTASDIAMEEAAAAMNPKSFMSIKSPSTQLRASGSDSDDDVFDDLDDDSTGGRASHFPLALGNQVDLLACARHPNPTRMKKTTRQAKARTPRKPKPIKQTHSYEDASLSSESSAYSSHSETDVEAHMKVARAWLNKIKTAFLGNDDDESIGNSTVTNNIQCEYAGVLGRLKIDINQD